MGKVIWHGDEGTQVVRDTSEPPPQPDERNAAIREEYRKLDEKKLQDERKKELQSERREKLIFWILLGAAFLIAVSGAALYFMLS